MYNVLVVEDAEDIRNLLVEQLGDKGLYVRQSGDGTAALVRAKGQKPDLMFVDIMMPVMDGIELISELQKNPDTLDIPIVLVTAVSTPDITMKAVRLGVQYRLTKPWEPEDLDYVLEQSLGLVSELDGSASRA